MVSPAREWAPLPAEPRVQCQWWAMCEYAATGTLSHPVLGAVPICDRCRRRVEEIEAE